jgi:ComF family protein
MPIPWLDRLTGAGRDFLAGLQHLVYPGCCLLCGRVLPEGEPHFCLVCRHDLFTDSSPSCPRCAGSIGPFAVFEGRCRACRDEQFAFEQVMRLGPYEGLLREVILRLKHQAGEGLAELLGECWADQAAAQLEALHVDAIVPVPLHWLRRWRRGYNQSAALGYGLSMRSRVPLQTSWLRRIRNTPEQTRQTPAGRKANVRGAFRVRRGAPVKGRNILLVDDVMTTGATANEAARALGEAGAGRVAVAVLARAQG